MVPYGNHPVPYGNRTVGTDKGTIVHPYGGRAVPSGPSGPPVRADWRILRIRVRPYGRTLRLSDTPLYPYLAGTIGSNAPVRLKPLVL